MFILPFNRDDTPVSTGWAFIALAVANTAVLIWVQLYSSVNTEAVVHGFIPATPRLATAFSAMFLHAGWFHLLGNLWFFWMFARRVESVFGGLLFLLVYLLCGLGGQGLHYYFNRASPIPVVGASGAISGIAGIYYVMFPSSKFDLDIYFGWARLKTFTTHTHGAVGAWILEQTILGLITNATHGSSIAFWGHVGGFFTGILLGVTIGLPLRHREGQIIYR